MVTEFGSEAKEPKGDGPRKLKSYTDPEGNQGNLTRATAYTSDGKVAEVQRSTTSSGNTITESYLYTYLTTGPNTGLLQNVRGEEKGHS